jgi:DNA polymerase-3 subunit delta
MRIVQYFEANPKAAPLQLIFPSLYNFFSKVLLVFTAGRDERSIAAALGISAFFARDYMLAASQYGPQGVETILLLLHQYNLKSLGIGDPGTDDMSLLREMLAKMMRE